jgi:hypothetical protein
LSEYSIARVIPKMVVKKCSDCYFFLASGVHICDYCLKTGKNLSATPLFDPDKTIDNDCPLAGYKKPKKGK